MRRHLRRHFSPVLIRQDVANGLLDASIVSLGFAFSLGFHPVIPIVAFLDGLLGRHLSKLRARIALRGGNGFGSNAAALLTHAAFGTLKMGVVLNPVAGFGLPLQKILAGSLSHSLSKGTFRLAFDKAFARGPEQRRALAVAYGSLANFGQSLLLGLVYKGSPAATALQIAFATTGVALVLVPVARRKLRRLRARDPIVLRHVAIENKNRPLMLPARPPRFAEPETVTRPLGVGTPRLA